jgi:hypothetical protein
MNFSKSATDKVLTWLKSLVGDCVNEFIGYLDVISCRLECERLMIYASLNGLLPLIIET